MTTDTPTPPSGTDIESSYHAFLHRASLASLIVAPALIALPPRKIDVYTYLLSGAFLVSATHLYNERRSVRQSIGGWSPAMELPDRAKDVKMRLDREREGRRLLEEAPAADDGVVVQHKGMEGEVGLFERKAKEVWMNGETEGWKERRLKVENEKIAKGEGYGSMIVDQISEVWNWGEKKAEEVGMEDKRYLNERRRKREEFPKVGKD